MNPELNSEMNYIVIDKGTQINSQPDIPNLENLKAEPERSSLRHRDENLNGATFKKLFSRERRLNSTNNNDDNNNNNNNSVQITSNC